MEPLLSPMPSPDHIVLQPKVELTDRLAKAGIMPEYVVEAVADDATAVSCRVLGCGRLLGYAPSAMSKHVAEKLAAQVCNCLQMNEWRKTDYVYSRILQVLLVD